jgi:hypothetical protein
VEEEWTKSGEAISGVALHIEDPLNKELDMLISSSGIFYRDEVKLMFK